MSRQRQHYRDGQHVQRHGAPAPPEVQPSVYTEAFGAHEGVRRLFHIRNGRAFLSAQQLQHRDAPVRACEESASRSRDRRQHRKDQQRFSQRNAAPRPGLAVVQTGSRAAQQPSGRERQRQRDGQRGAQQQDAPRGVREHNLTRGKAHRPQNAVFGHRAAIARLHQRDHRRA